MAVKNNMTRLVVDDLKTISLKKYDEHLHKIIGAGLLKIGETALKIDVDKNLLKSKKVRVVPITSGEGIISGFSQSVADIIKYIGFEDCTVTEHSDVWGYSEAYNEKADIIFAADDDRFISINTKNREVRDNGYDTGCGYAAALDLACNGIKGKEVLVIGGNFVGTGAVDYLVKNEAKVTLCELDEAKSSKLKKDYPVIHLEDCLNNALLTHDLILDCTPSKDFISDEYITKNTIISTPGIPLGIERCDVEKKGGILIHDVLEIGVVVMALGAL